MAFVFPPFRSGNTATITEPALGQARKTMSVMNHYLSQWANDPKGTIRVIVPPNPFEGEEAHPLTGPLSPTLAMIALNFLSGGEYPADHVMEEITESIEKQNA